MFAAYVRNAQDSFVSARSIMEHARQSDQPHRSSYVESARRMNRVGVQWLKNTRMVAVMDARRDR